ncbi:diacylglycerol kinase family protein [Dactylosporangium sp. NPDC050588]|uniref:diacylglycerol/lipid kinase family protein n=1 Tax=Dactylosporangium sp. NPDC050588 TaxID=3157211 RepID=UPI00340A39C8
MTGVLGGWAPYGERVLVVTNELAGRTEAEAVESVLGVLRETGDVETMTCGHAGDVDRILDTRRGRRLVVVGGDGSLHTMVGALLRRGEAATCEVALIPLGTGNDFARGAGIPVDDLHAAARIAAAGIAGPIDLIVADGDGVVINAVHVGAGAEAALKARPLKKRLKIAAFPIGAVLAGFTARGWRLRVTVDGAVVSRGRRRVLMAGLSNAPTIAGGTGELAPDADPTDGLADITVSFAVGPLARVGYALALRKGRHPGRDDVIHLRGRDIHIEGDPFHVNADGELTGPFRSRRWTVAQDAWLLVR